ncbi:MAG: hypothetical protein ACLR8Y_05530 [Alistipes indistinctus]
MGIFAPGGMNFNPPYREQYRRIFPSDTMKRMEHLQRFRGLFRYSGRSFS